MAKMPSTRLQVLALRYVIKQRKTRYLLSGSLAKHRLSRLSKRDNLQYHVDIAWPIGTISRTPDGRFILDENNGRLLENLFDDNVGRTFNAVPRTAPRTRYPLISHTVQRNVAVVGNVVVHRADDTEPKNYFTSTPVEGNDKGVFKISGISSILQSSSQHQGSEIRLPPRCITPINNSYDDFGYTHRDAFRSPFFVQSGSTSRQYGLNLRDKKHVECAPSQTIAIVYGQKQPKYHKSQTRPQVQSGEMPVPSVSETLATRGVLHFEPKAKHSGVRVPVDRLDGLVKQNHNRAPDRLSVFGSNIESNTGVRNLFARERLLRRRGFSSGLHRVSEDGAVAEDPTLTTTNRPHYDRESPHRILQKLRQEQDELHSLTRRWDEGRNHSHSLPEVPKPRSGVRYLYPSTFQKNCGFRHRESSLGVTQLYKTGDVYTPPSTTCASTVGGASNAASAVRIRTQHLTPGYHRVVHPFHGPSPNESKSSSGVSSGLGSQGLRGLARLSVNSNLTSVHDSAESNDYDCIPLNRAEVALSTSPDEGVDLESSATKLQTSQRFHMNYWLRHPHLPPVNPDKLGHSRASTDYSDSEARCAALREEFRQFRQQVHGSAPDI